MREHNTQVMLIGRIDGLSGANFFRLDTLDELTRIPPGFGALIWIDSVEVVGPALERTRPRADVRQ
jgi:hypothetical protein